MERNAKNASQRSDTQVNIVDSASSLFNTPDVGIPQSSYAQLGEQDNYDVTDEFASLDETKQKNPKCFGGCSNPIEKSNWLDELNATSERTKNNISLIAKDAGENAVFAKLEFLLERTMFHVRFDKKSNGRWENSGRDLVELFDENQTGGERKSRYEQLKRDMEGAKVGMVFSEPTIYDHINYVQVFIDTGNTIEEYVVQFQGNQEDFSRLYSSFAQSSDNLTESLDVNYDIPLRFINDVSLDVFVDKIEKSYATEESRQQSSEYLERLKYDMAHLPQIDEYQKEAQKLAEYLEQQMLTQGISHAVLSMLAGELDAYAKGETSIQDLNISENKYAYGQYIESSSSVVEYYTQSINEIHATYLEYTQSEIVHSFNTVFDVLDGNFGSDAVLELSTTPDIEESAVTLQEVWIQKAVETLSISVSEATLVLATTEKLHEMFIDQRNSLQVVETLNVGHGAIFFALEAFTMTELPIPQHEETVVISPEYSDASNVQREFSKEQLSEIYSVILAPMVLDRINDKPIEQQMKNLHELNLPEYATDIDLALFMQVIEFLQMFDNSPSEQKIDLIKTEQLKSMEKIQALHQSIVDVVSKRHIHHEKSFRKSEFMQNNQNQFNESASKELDVHIENFSLALSFWMMIKLIQYDSVLKNIETNIKNQLVSPESKSVNAPKELCLENASDFIQKEPAPWLLFAIIWHLAMIREQGFAQSNAQSAGKKQKKNKSNTNLPIQIPSNWTNQLHVIYAYSS